MQIAIVGGGHRCTQLIEAAAAVDGVQIALVVDPSASARKKIARAYPDLPTSAAIETVLQAPQIDAAIVASPDYTHSEIGVALLGAGKHVLMDKPLATTIAAADLLVRAAQTSQSLLYPGHNMRFMPVVEILRRVVKQGLIGTPRAAWTRHFIGRGGDYFFRDWHCEAKYSGGLLVHKACHDFDALAYILEAKVSAVQAIGTNAVYHKCSRRRPQDPAPEIGNHLAHWPPLDLPQTNPRMDVEDLASVNMVYDNGVLGSYQQCHFTPDYWRNYCIIGDCGRVENCGDSPGGSVLVWNQRRDGFASEPDLCLPIADPLPGHAGSDIRMLTDFVEAAQKMHAPRTSIASARNAVATGVMARKSLRARNALLELPACPGT